MTIVTNPAQRRFWHIKLHQAHNRISDLRAEVTVALQSKVSVAVMELLVEVDTDLTSAQTLLAVADVKITQLERTS